MFLTYIGESGITGITSTDPSQMHQVYTGLFVHESQSISINGEFNALCRRHFGTPLGEEGAPDALRPVDIYQGLGFFFFLAYLEEERTHPRLPGDYGQAGNPGHHLLRA